MRGGVKLCFCSTLVQSRGYCKTLFCGPRSGVLVPICTSTMVYTANKVGGLCKGAAKSRLGSNCIAKGLFLRKIRLEGLRFVRCCPAAIRQKGGEIVVPRSIEDRN